GSLGPRRKRYVPSLAALRRAAAVCDRRNVCRPCELFLGVLGGLDQPRIGGVSLHALHRDNHVSRLLEIAELKLQGLAESQPRVEQEGHEGPQVSPLWPIF